MDPITHGLLGATTAHVLLGRPFPRAWMVGALAALAPDLDVLIRSEADPLLAIEHHRGFTHSLAFIPVGGAIAALPWLAGRRARTAWRLVMGASIAGYATHPLLDACTTYGTQLLWPFSSSRVAWHVISIVDPLFTLPLLAGLLSAVLTRARAPAVLALAFCLAYLGHGLVQRERALGVQHRIAAARGQAPVRGEVFPAAATQLVWRSLYRAGDTLHANRIRVPWFGPVTPGRVRAHLGPALPSGPAGADRMGRSRVGPPDAPGRAVERDHRPAPGPSLTGSASAASRVSVVDHVLSVAPAAERLG
jgi:inner membrane protein